MAIRVHAPPQSLPEVRAMPSLAPRLVRLLRTARLSLLFGPPQIGKTSLLQREVMPLLRRRASDLPPGQRGKTRVVVPINERRGRSDGSIAIGGFELPIVFSDWAEAPLERLREQIDRLTAPLAPDVIATGWPSLADAMQAASERRGARFLIVLDGFEAYLSKPPGDPDVLTFDDALVEAVHRPFLSAHFLLVMRSSAEPLLERYRALIPRFDDHVLRFDEPPPGPSQSPLLWRGAGPTVVPPSRPVPEEIAAAALEAPAQEPGGGSLSGAPKDLPTWSLSLDAILNRVAEASLHDAGSPSSVAAVAASPAAASAPVDQLTLSLPPARAFLEPLPMPPIPTAAARPPPLANAPENRLPPVGRRVPPWWMAASLGTLAVVALLLWPRETPQPAPPEATVAPVAPPAPVVAAAPAEAPIPARPLPVLPPLPRFDLAIDTSASDARIADDLARSVGPVAGLDLAPLPIGGWAQGLASAPGVPRLSIVRYDALQAARQRTDIGSLHVVAPLYTEPLGFVVRDDSPLRFIHQIKGRALNIGTPDSGRALTAAGVYERMFGTRPPASTERALDQDAALRRLKDGAAIDVVVTLGQAPAEGSGLRLLALDPANPASRKALQGFLPVSLGATPTLGVMNFLVAPDPQDEAVATQLGQLAAALCRQLPTLRETGDSRWSQVNPALTLDIGWPYLPAAQAALQSCNSPERSASASRPAAIIPTR